jgi:dTDP-4-amino-4,6-dideoxygalactose transaminase
VRTIPFGRPILGESERQAVLEVLDSGILVHGPRFKAFESAFAAFTGAPHAVAVASCTAGLHLAYFHLGIGAGDEVIVPAMTHTATAHAVELMGATPVFVDAEPVTGNIDLDQLEGAITPRTRAISLVHFLGMPVDMGRLMAIAKPRGLFVVEDSALAVGSRFDGTHVGLHGDVGTFSFYPVKQLTTGEGGMLITRDAELARSVGLKRAFGVDRHVGERRVPGLYDVVDLGFNYRMSEIEAALGVCQMERIGGFLQQRKANHETMTKGLRELPELQLLQSSHDAFESSHYCLSVLLSATLAPNREALMAALGSRGVGTSIYYPAPVPRMSYYREKYGYPAGGFPNAERIADTSVALPVGPHLEGDDVQYVVDSVKESIQEVRSA